METRQSNSTSVDSSGTTLPGLDSRILNSRRIQDGAYLPPSFELIPRLLLFLEDLEVNCGALADLIRVDAALTAGVIRLANSALHARGNRTQTLTDAINRVGLREVYRTVMKIIASPVLLNSEQTGLERLDLWRHSLATAVAAQFLARTVALEDPEVAFTAALLHDIGKVLICQAVGPDYISLVEDSKLTGKPLYEAEMAIFGTDHTQVAAKVMQHWNFPERIISAVAMHHHPANAPRAHAPLAALIYAGDILAYRSGNGYGFPSFVIDPDPAFLELINLTPASLEATEEEVRLAIVREQAPFQE
ncbi:MAG: putative signal transduction protein [Verrucomicrobiales bacterium]|nr:putative signal transduction protein [Verrucomicrobiales bacterium]